jgi:hypothetical protein
MGMKVGRYVGSKLSTVVRGFSVAAPSPSPNYEQYSKPVRSATLPEILLMHYNAIVDRSGGTGATVVSISTADSNVG